MGPHMSRGAGALSQLCRHDAYASRALSPDDSRQDRALASLDEERGQVGALLLAWYWAHKKGKDRTIDVRSYTNCESVELFLNGKSKGRKDRQPNSSLSWQVEWEPGVLEAKGYRDGKLVAETRRETAGEPAGIALEPDRSSINADGEDVSLVKVRILDAQGRLVPTAGNEVKFTVEGPGEIIGVGNGDPSSHEPDKAESRSAFNGLCLVIIQGAKKPGAIKLTAESEGLEKTVVEITALKAPIRPRVQ